VRHGRATGVVLDNGERIEADVVLSNADPKRTFLTLVDRNALEPGFLEGVQRLKTNISCLKFHCALRELPDFSAYLGKDFDPKVLAQIRICPSVDYFEQSWDDAKRGRPSSCPVMYVQLPSVYDRSLTPPGQHVMSVWSLYAPVRLREGAWDDARQQVGEHLIDTLAQYAPNIREVMIDWELFTPADLERRVYLTDGNIRHLDIIPQQMLAGRPNRQLSGYRTPIEGLYLCGAGTHPGGEVTGAPGHNAAHAVLRDWEVTRG
jgi:phytoene dehydrogenase-like protein